MTDETTVQVNDEPPIPVEDLKVESPKAATGACLSFMVHEDDGRKCWCGKPAVHQIVFQDNKRELFICDEHYFLNKWEEPCPSCKGDEGKVLCATCEGTGLKHEFTPEDLVVLQRIKATRADGTEVPLEELGYEVKMDALRAQKRLTAAKTEQTAAIRATIVKTTVIALRMNFERKWNMPFHKSYNDRELIEIIGEPFEAMVEAGVTQHLAGYAAMERLKEHHATHVVNPTPQGIFLATEQDLKNLKGRK